MRIFSTRQGLAPDAESQPLEKLCARTRPTPEMLATRPHCDFREVILLSCVRNAVVNRDGSVRWERFGGRLAAAGWTSLAFATRRGLNPPRTLEDLLNFKKAVRSIATQHLSAQEEDQQVAKAKPP